MFEGYNIGGQGDLASEVNNRGIRTVVSLVQRSLGQVGSRPLKIAHQHSSSAEL